MKKIKIKDNGEELSYILDELRKLGTLDEESCQIAIDAVEDIYNKSVL